MGPGWLDLAAELTATDDQLRFWLDIAIEFTVSRQPAGAFPDPSERASGDMSVTDAEEQVFT
jgi:hypothetical protein